jgi:arginyl-tRNA synthetase
VKPPSTNPFGAFRQECEAALTRAVQALVPSCHADQMRLVRPPTSAFGDLASSLCFEVAQHVKTRPAALAEQVVARIDLPRGALLRRVESAGGYINFYADDAAFAALTLSSVKALGPAYGYVTTATPATIIVEHTSVNPAGPIHVGTARNSILGDALYRLLRARGHAVRADFYVDDVGRQIAVLAYGFQLVSHLPRQEKIDHWLGLVYAATSCIIEITKLKRALQRLRDAEAPEGEARKIQAELDDWLAAAGALCEQDDGLFYGLLERIQRDEDPEQSIARIMQAYEAGEDAIRRVVREVVDLCLSGFKETYGRVHIDWDAWDWESDLVWDGAVAEVVRQLAATPYCQVVDGALTFDAERAAQAHDVKARLGIPRDHEIPALVLNRSDGTTLYSTRDIAYSLWKLRQADRVINVIGKEQALAQTQIRIALSVLTSPETALNMVHYAYELVQLPGYRMSKRRGRYVTLDELLDEAEKRAWDEVEKRSPHLAAREKAAIAQAVGGGAVKYALVSIAPTKQVLFSWDRVLNFEMNSAPFIQYAYARAANILNKAGALPQAVEYSQLHQPAEHELVRKIAVFPEVFIEAAETITPNSLAEFANDLAASFNSFYASVPVLQADSPEQRAARLALVDAVKTTIHNAMSLLGIEVLERM